MQFERTAPVFTAHTAYTGRRRSHRPVAHSAPLFRYAGTVLLSANFAIFHGPSSKIVDCEQRTYTFHTDTIAQTVRRKRLDILAPALANSCSHSNARTGARRFGCGSSCWWHCPYCCALKCRRSWLKRTAEVAALQSLNEPTVRYKSTSMKALA